MFYPQQNGNVAKDQNAWSRHPNIQHNPYPLFTPSLHAHHTPIHNSHLQPGLSPHGQLGVNNHGLSNHPLGHPLQSHIPPPLSHHQHHPSLSLPHFSSPPTANAHSHLLHSHGISNGSPGSSQSTIISPHWQQQLLKCETIRSCRSPHHRARAHAMASRPAAKAAIPITNPNKPVVPVPDPDSKDTPDGAPPGSATDGSPSVAAARANHPSATVAPITQAPRPTAAKPPQNTWSALDMGGVRLKTLPPSSALFGFTFLINLYLNHNDLTSVPPAISRLRHLELLDLSGNALSSVPPELGMLTNLKELYLFDNMLTGLPVELGSLHQLRTLGIEGNPLDGGLRALVQKDGTPALISYLRDTAPIPAPPPPRTWVSTLTPAERTAYAADRKAQDDAIRVLSYNVLAQKCATERLYGYTPAWALAWDYRKELVMAEVLRHRAEIVCLQEVEKARYEDFWQGAMREAGYDGIYWWKGRWRSQGEGERATADGCATFYKRDRFVLVDSRPLEFATAAMQRPDFKKTDDMFNRVLGKDHIALLALLGDRKTGARLVCANAHLHWDPAYRDVKLVQAAMLAEEVERAVRELAGKEVLLDPVPGESSENGDIGDTISFTAPFSATAVDGSLSDADADLSAPPTPAYPHEPHTPGQPRHAQSYPDPALLPVLVIGDFNSVSESGVYEFLRSGHVPPTHVDWMGHTYGRYTAAGAGPRHRLGLRSAYGAAGLDGGDRGVLAGTAGVNGVQDPEMSPLVPEDSPVQSAGAGGANGTPNPASAMGAGASAAAGRAVVPGEAVVTNHTPSYQGVLDYLWYSERTLGVTGVLGPIDAGYLDKCVGFPNAHFPSDHVSIVAEFRIKAVKDGGR